MGVVRSGYEGIRSFFGGVWRATPRGVWVYVVGFDFHTMYTPSADGCLFGSGMLSRECRSGAVA